MFMVVPNFVKSISCQKITFATEINRCEDSNSPALTNSTNNKEWFSIGPPPSLVFIKQWSWITTLIHYQSEMILYQFGQEEATMLLNRTSNATSRLSHKLPITHISLFNTGDTTDWMDLGFFWIFSIFCVPPDLPLWASSDKRNDTQRSVLIILAIAFIGVISEASFVQFILSYAVPPTPVIFSELRNNARGI